jgi:hypothetical protein
METHALLDATRSEDPTVVRQALLALRTLDEGARAALGTRVIERLAAMAEHLHTTAAPELTPHYGTVLWAFIAASLRLRGAHRPLARLFALDDDTLNEIWDDILTEDGAILLADTYDGDPAALRALLRTAEASPYARVEALSAARLLVERGELTRATALELFTVGAEAVLARATREADEIDPDDETFASLALAEAEDFAAWELRGTLQKLVDADLWDESITDLNTLLARLRPGAKPQPHERPWPVGDVWTCVSWWDWFKDQPDRNPRRRANCPSRAGSEPTEPWALEDLPGAAKAEPSTAENDLPPPPVVRESPKVGRNDPCPCGSGKKFKKCCGG